jgi:ABC-type multidrug transport system fused ATPase/permease subunit
MLDIVLTYHFFIDETLSRSLGLSAVHIGLRLCMFIWNTLYLPIIEMAVNRIIQKLSRAHSVIMWSVIFVICVLSLLMVVNVILSWLSQVFFRRMVSLNESHTSGLNFVALVPNDDSHRAQSWTVLKHRVINIFCVWSFVLWCKSGCLVCSECTENPGSCVTCVQWIMMGVNVELQVQQ